MCLGSFLGGDSPQGDGGIGAPQTGPFPSATLPSHLPSSIFLPAATLWHTELYSTAKVCFPTRAANESNVDFCDSFPNRAEHAVNCDLVHLFQTGLVLCHMGQLKQPSASSTTQYPNSLETCWPCGLSPVLPEKRCLDVYMTPRMREIG